jgi:hypothetical protein
MAGILTELGLTSGGKLVTQLPLPKKSRLDLLVQGGKRRIGFVFDETDHGTRFAGLTKALLDELEAGAMDHLVVWRRGEVPAGWKAGRERWARLGARPDVSLVAPSADTLRRLAAFRQLCRELQADGRDHREEAAAAMPGALGACPELQAALGLVGAGAAGQAPEPRPPASPVAGLPDGSGAVRDLVARLVQERKVLRRSNLLELVGDAGASPVEAGVFERALDDLERAGLLWRLEAAREDYVVCFR